MLVKIVQLPRCRTVSFHVRESETPEQDAWALLKEWAVPRGLFANPTIHQIFGRNNPQETGGKVLPGYEYLITVPETFVVDSDLTEVILPGGLYAVVSSRGIAAMVKNYERIAEWLEASELYALDYPENYDGEQNPGLELEHHIDPYHDEENVLLIDAYIPVKYRE